MFNLTKESFERPADLTDTDDPAVLYARSYLLTRTVVGFIGMALPIALIVAEVFMDGGVRVRGSLSAYYHSSARDIFVGALCVVGVLLITYLSGQKNTMDYWFSLVAGIAALGVVFFPTARPDLPEGAASCGVSPMPAGCAAMQQKFGETPVAVLHFVCAAIFIVSLAVLCFVFAHREKEHKGHDGMAALLRGCGWAILAAVAWVGIGSFFELTVVVLTPLYLGEMISVWAFGIAWLAKGRDLWKALLPRP